MPEMSGDDSRKLDLDPDKLYLVHLMTKAGLSKSNGEARKLIQGGGVSIDSERISDPNHEFAVSSEMILKVGKRRFLKLNP